MQTRSFIVIEIDSIERAIGQARGNWPAARPACALACRWVVHFVAFACAIRREGSGWRGAAT